MVPQEKSNRQCLFWGPPEGLGGGTSLLVSGRSGYVVLFGKNRLGDEHIDCIYPFSMLDMRAEKGSEMDSRSSRGGLLVG